jgi:hypothetical protein
MEKRNILTKILAILGTVLVWFPIISTVVVALAGTIRSGIPRFDYLMPAELFPFALVGGILLFWASFRAHSHLRLIGWGLAVAFLSLVGSQGLAVVTGVASGKTEMSAELFAFLLGMILAYSFALILTGVGGILLLRDLFRPSVAAIPSD